jgi:hypothetical protein
VGDFDVKGFYPITRAIRHLEARGVLTSSEAFTDFLAGRRILLTGLLSLLSNRCSIAYRIA